MDLEIHQLQEPTQAIEEYLRRDLARNGLLLYDLIDAFDLSEWYIAIKNDTIQACLVIYKGGRGMESFMTRGRNKAVQALINQLPHSLIFTICPQHHVPLVEKQYLFLNRAEFILMELQQTKYSPPELHPAEALSLANLIEVDTFYQNTAAGAWNPVQLNIGPFHCIRDEGSIVSICGTIGIYRSNPGVAVIGNLQTLPAYQRRGYGTSVLCHVINALFETYQYVTLMVESENKEAIRIYKRLGFTIHDVFMIGVCQRIQ